MFYLVRLKKDIVERIMIDSKLFVQPNEGNEIVLTQKEFDKNEKVIDHYRKHGKISCVKRLKDPREK
jgi:hypothetical protein